MTISEGPTGTECNFMGICEAEFNTAGNVCARSEEGRSEFEYEYERG